MTRFDWALRIQSYVPLSTLWTWLRKSNGCKESYEIPRHVECYIIGTWERRLQFQKCNFSTYNSDVTILKGPVSDRQCFRRTNVINLECYVLKTSHVKIDSVTVREPCLYGVKNCIMFWKNDDKHIWSSVRHSRSSIKWGMKCFIHILRTFSALR